MRLNPFFLYLTLALTFFIANPLYAEDPRIIVALFEAPPQDDAIAREATVAAAKEIAETRGFKYVSPYDLAAVRIKNPDFARKAPKDITGHYSKEAMAAIEEAVEPFSKEFLGGLEVFTAFDLTVSGKMSRPADKIRLEMKIARNKSWREREVTREFSEERLDSEVRAATRELLKAVAPAQIVYADKVHDEDLSQVLYFVTTDGGKEITVGVDYAGDRPNPEIQGVRILPPESMEKKGSATLYIDTLQGRKISADFTFKDGKLYSVLIDTPIPDASSDAEQIEKLEFRSGAGHILVFEFKWKDRKVEYAKLYPKVNAFSDDRI